MGGRGAGSGKGGGFGKGVHHVRVNFKGGGSSEYVANGNNVYRRSDMEHIPGVTPKQLLTNAKRQGHGVLVITNKDYNDGRKAAEKFLDTQWHRAAPRPRKGMKGH